MTPSPDLYSRPEIFVGGRWRPSVDGTEHKVVNPASGDKQSGTGREMGPEGLASYRELTSSALGAKA
jgi:hypothetical protein